MSSSLEKYYNKKNESLNLDNLVKSELKKKFRSSYKVFKENDNKISFDIIYEFRKKVNPSLTHKEGMYIYNLCRNKYLKDKTPLVPRGVKKKKELKFNNLNEWAEYRAQIGTKFKDIDFYKCLVETYPQDKTSRVTKLLEEQFQLELSPCYVMFMYRDYCKKVKTEV